MKNNILYYTFLSILIVLLSSCNNDDQTNPEDASNSPENAIGGGMTTENDFYHFTPMVITPESPEIITLEIFNQRIAGNSKPVLKTVWGADITLNDNGTNGDKKAGDNIYTAMINKQQIMNTNTPSALNKPSIGQVQFPGGTFLGIHAEIWNADIPEVEVQSISSSAQKTSRIFNISSSTISTQDIAGHISQFYSYFEDDYDFINVIYPGYNLSRFHIDIKSDVQGIGKPHFDNTNNVGSEGRLLGVNVFPNTVFYDGASDFFSQVLSQQWVNFLEGTILEEAIPFWPLSDLASGMMGRNGLMFPYNLVARDNNTWFLEPRTEAPAFNDLELYLMGLIPANEVMPHIVFDNQNQNLGAGITLTGPVTTINIEDIVNTVGPRIPNVSDSPKQFKIATIIVSHSLLNAKEMSFYHQYTQRAELREKVLVKTGYNILTTSPFHIATGGRAEVITRLE